MTPFVQDAVHLFYFFSQLAVHRFAEVVNTLGFGHPLSPSHMHAQEVYWGKTDCQVVIGWNR